jgi:hypothetical protein
MGKEPGGLPWRGVSQIRISTPPRTSTGLCKRSSTYWPLFSNIPSTGPIILRPSRFRGFPHPGQYSTCSA